MKLLGILDLVRAVADAYTARKKAKGPDAADDFNKEADRAQKAQVARDVRALQRALKRKRLLAGGDGGKAKKPAKPPKRR